MKLKELRDAIKYKRSELAALEQALEILAKYEEGVDLELDPTEHGERIIRRLRHHIPKTCVACGDDFKAKKSHARFCSKRCYDQDYKTRPKKPSKPAVLVPGDPLRAAH